MTRPAAALAAGLLLATAGACSNGGGEGTTALTTPTFGTVATTTSLPGDGTSTTVSTVASTEDPVEPTAAPQTTTVTGDAPTTTTAAAAEQERVTVDDPDDDATGGLDDNPPPWSDLAGVTMVRQGNAYALRVQLAGGTAPERSDGTNTMNIASFYDVDGDGSVDYEIWANLGPDGWGGSWFDDEDHGAFGEDSNVSIEVHGDEIVVLFPDVLLAEPSSFQFSLSSEYGSMDVLGSSFARRDDVPNDDGAVAFPG